MTHPIGIADRLRIERATWAIDYRLQDLPRRTRIAKRRELRTNLRAAAEDVGARQAVRQLGDLRRLAADYLDAEYGEVARRPSWTAAAIALLAVDAAMLVLSAVVTSVFRAGSSPLILTRRDRSTGTGCPTCSATRRSPSPTGRARPMGSVDAARLRRDARCDDPRGPVVAAVPRPAQPPPRSVDGLGAAWSRRSAFAVRCGPGHSASCSLAIASTPCEG